MGAGIPRQIPGILDRLARGEAASLKLDVHGDASGHSTETHFDPGDFFEPPPELIRPRFIAIVSSSTLALTLTKKSSGRVDGFVIEGPVAGGHNAPPRGPAQRSPLGEPIYGPRDVPDLAAFRALALPFWLAGGMGRPGQLAEALKQGATGIQVGTPFAFCEESGIDPRIKEKVLNAAQSGTLEVFTDPDASPTGFPFKVVRMPGSLSDPETVRERNVSVTSDFCERYIANRMEISDIVALENVQKTTFAKAAHSLKHRGVSAFAMGSSPPSDSVKTGRVNRNPAWSRQEMTPSISPNGLPPVAPATPR
jgi:NAD(P)H-dependent flavin oxidoreductase YrpB (nitropropane dioxygenase family)